MDEEKYLKRLNDKHKFEEIYSEISKDGYWC